MDEPASETPFSHPNIPHQPASPPLNIQHIIAAATNTAIDVALADVCQETTDAHTSQSTITELKALSHPMDMSFCSHHMTTKDHDDEFDPSSAVSDTT